MLLLDKYGKCIVCDRGKIKKNLRKRVLNHCQLKKYIFRSGHTFRDDDRTLFIPMTSTYEQRSHV